MQYIDLMDAAKKAFYSPIDYRNRWNDAVETMPRWISVEEWLPEGEVLAANFAKGTYGYKEYIIGYVFPPRVTEPGGYYAENDYETLHDVTHWMPLPEPPEEDDHGKK